MAVFGIRVDDDVLLYHSFDMDKTFSSKGLRCIYIIYITVSGSQRDTKRIFDFV